MTKEMISMDANEAVARVAHKVSEVIAIYPITPSSPMGSGRTSGRRKEKRTSGEPCHWWLRCRRKAARRARCMARCKRGR